LLSKLTAVQECDARKDDNGSAAHLNNIIMRVVLCLLLCSFLSSAYAEDFYASSVAEANKLCSEAKAGDKVIMQSGIYTDAVINFQNNNGTTEKPVMFIAETGGEVSFFGNSTLSFSGKNIIVEGFTWQNGGKDLGTKSVIEIKGSYCVLRNCAIIDYNVSDFKVDNKWVSIYGEYNTVDQCLLQDKRNLGATLTVWLKDGVPAHHTISRNYFLNRINGPNEGNGLESIRIGDSKTSFTNAHCVVAFNRFENCDGEIEIISNKSCHNSYFHNTFYNNDGGLTLRHGNNCLVDGNVFDGGEKLKSYGVRIIGEGHLVTNNYFYNLKGAAKESFRAPLTIVNGLENTPLNGYFQVRRAVVAGNIFANNITPNIRVGARSKREGMTIAPDTVAILNNIVLDENCIGTEVYQELSEAANVSFSGNKVLGKCLSAPKKGFDKYPSGKRDGLDLIKDNAGNVIASVEKKEVTDKNLTSGADWIHPSIITAIRDRKYTLTSAKEVGPTWLR
jgi:poly(beta-D-mannuronate) lyase